MHGSSDCADQNSTYVHACIQTFVCICIQHRVLIILLTSPLYAGDKSLPVIVGAVVGAIGIAIFIGLHITVIIIIVVVWVQKRSAENKKPAPGIQPCQSQCVYMLLHSITLSSK